MMFFDEGVLFLTPADIVRHLACARASALDLEVATQRRVPPARQPMHVFARAAIRQRDRLSLETNARFGSSAVTIIDNGERTDLHSAAEKTLEALNAGVGAISHGVLQLQIGEHIVLHTTIDLLIRSEDGPYEAHLTTLATSPRSKHRSIAMLTSHIVAEALTQDPQPTTLVLGTGDREQIAAHTNGATRMIEQVLRHLEPRLNTLLPTPTAHRKSVCRACRFEPECAALWEAEGDLSLVAGIGEVTVMEYQSAGVENLAALAAGDPHDPPIGIDATQWRKDVEQASLQAKARTSGTIPVEIIDRTRLNHLPAPRPSDLYFDIEGYSVPPLRWEYLFGLWDGLDYLPIWAHSPNDEQAMFVRFIEEVMGRREDHPDLHIFHFNHYEPAVLRQMADRFSLHQREVQEICDVMMIDLLPIVRGSLRAGLPGYGLKNLERLHGFVRASGMQTAGESVDSYDRWLYEGHDPSRLDDIASYNLEDLRSTQSLHHWLAKQ